MLQSENSLRPVSINLIGVKYRFVTVFDPRSEDRRLTNFASLVLDRGQKETDELLHHEFRMQLTFRGQKETDELLHHGFRMQLTFRGQKRGVIASRVWNAVCVQRTERDGGDSTSRI
ncbi:hypothetical protein LEP1GSC133_0969 [Leptospira borgpetersenii serovar Pomona str. 200901868]|uniref:Uncharacterized protein n=1 Tax=Leptospira borgpetersenii serovar Pomona str. 200901868 TaxID=1192866 RepID=M6W4Q5_LEPBO|nr:hypothetical protein LEP1GSC133_0086 [Leptospira borgpetersenii serovar Pomona str. 200901868]EMO64090.1 hypothetical protein LEP1GSC133_0969 [Leptospira borgpetersenii serovar Pomona str. 200901868]